MKAKEYVTLFHDFLAMKVPVYDGQPVDAKIGVTDAIIGICNRMFNEGIQLAKARNITTRASQDSIMREINERWKAFCRLLGDPTVNPELFKLYVQTQHPDIFELITW